MLLSHNQAVASPFQTGVATANDTTPPTSSNPATSTATITANDFLQLLVTELQNQDPTANTDPNEYVDQLVQVNSLQQLIQIDDNTTPATTTTDPSSGDVAKIPGGSHAMHGAALSTADVDSSSDSTSVPGTSGASLAHTAAEQRHLHPSEYAGNLSANVDTQSTMAASANRVASSLQPRRQERTTSPGTSAITAGRFSAH